MLSKAARLPVNGDRNADEVAVGSLLAVLRVELGVVEVGGLPGCLEVARSAGRVEHGRVVDGVGTSAPVRPRKRGGQEQPSSCPVDEVGRGRVVEALVDCTDEQPLVRFRDEREAAEREAAQRGGRDGSAEMIRGVRRRAV